jgi:hypothetical protein
VTATVAPPTVAEVVVLTVSVVEPDLVTDAGLNVPVTPDGNPDTPKFTVPVKPFTGVTVTVYELLLPASTVCDEGETATE